MPTETNAGRRRRRSARRFNEAVGSCPRKRRQRHRADDGPRASMRPWARAHGNAPTNDVAVWRFSASMRPWARAHGNRSVRCASCRQNTASMRPWARAHGNVFRKMYLWRGTVGFNEAVGSCPRKRLAGRCADGRNHASMRPWARAHGNDMNSGARSPTTACFNEAVGSCPRKLPVAGEKRHGLKSFNEAVGSCPRKHATPEGVRHSSGLLQ